ncbi:hypothetical protein Plhal304r1_c070g0158971 [Plasmopara halstedii]
MTRGLPKNWEQLLSQSQSNFLLQTLRRATAVETSLPTPRVADETRSLLSARGATCQLLERRTSSMDSGFVSTL